MLYAAGSFYSTTTSRLKVTNMLHSKLRGLGKCSGKCVDGKPPRTLSAAAPQLKTQGYVSSL